MCPSGSVEAIADSDEYLVVELQPMNHELAFLRPGPLAPRALARSLNDWATFLHRENVRHSVAFHAGELPDKLGGVNADADAFVAEVVATSEARAVASSGPSLLARRYGVLWRLRPEAQG